MMIKIVKKGRGWFQTYEENPTATNLSMAGGGARLLSILLLIAAIPCTVAVLMAVARVSMVGSVGTALIFLMDEMDDLLPESFFEVYAAFVFLIETKREVLRTMPGKSTGLHFLFHLLTMY